MALRRCAYILIACLGFVYGCETAGAFGTGRITPSDVAYITHAGTLGKRTSPVNVAASATDDEPAVAETAPARRPKSKRGLAQTDAWLEENLW